MIKSWSSIPAFQTALRESQMGGKAASYYWRRRGPRLINVYFQGRQIAETDSTISAMFLARDHAKRIGLYFEAEIPEHYFRHDKEKGEWVLYVGGRFNKKGKIKTDLEEYLRVASWMKSGEHGNLWSSK
jgi:hypothetical protein